MSHASSAPAVPSPRDPPGEVGREATGEIEQPTLWIAR
jgi:hypothetical protein